MAVLLEHLDSRAVAGCESGVSGSVAWIVAGSDAWLFCQNVGMSGCGDVVILGPLLVSGCVAWIVLAIPSECQDSRTIALAVPGLSLGMRHLAVPGLSLGVVLRVHSGVLLGLSWPFCWNVGMSE